jgi:uncharacterized protein YlxW (UPF0749 family)
VVALCVALAGCGGSSNASTQVHAVARKNRQCDGSKVAAKRERQRAQLNADLRTLETSAATLKQRTETGNPAINRALDRFLLDVAGESLPVHERSRFIDHAAAIVALVCYLCWQALESGRPLAVGAKLACG